MRLHSTLAVLFVWLVASTLAAEDGAPVQLPRADATSAARPPNASSNTTQATTAGVRVTGISKSDSTRWEESRTALATALGEAKSSQLADRFLPKERDTANTLAEAAQMMWAARLLADMQRDGMEAGSVLEKTNSLNQFTMGWGKIGDGAFRTLAEKNAEMLKTLVDEGFSADARKRSGFDAWAEKVWMGGLFVREATRPIDEIIRSGATRPANGLGDDLRRYNPQEDHLRSTQREDKPPKVSVPFALFDPATWPTWFWMALPIWVLVGVFIMKRRERAKGH